MTVAPLPCWRCGAAPVLVYGGDYIRLRCSAQYCDGAGPAVEPDDEARATRGWNQKARAAAKITAGAKLRRKSARRATTPLRKGT